MNKPLNKPLNKIVVLNPKGGCGKSTLVTNIAACYAKRGAAPVVMDYDPQGSTMGWLDRRSVTMPTIQGIAAYKRNMQATRSWQLRVPSGTAHLIVDSPAGVTSDQIRELTRGSSSILVPVLPSLMDIHAASRCIADLLLVAKINRSECKLAVVANRTRKNTESLAKLMRFLDALGIPVVAVLRDSQNYVRAAELGMGLHDMSPSRVSHDIGHIERLVEWLDDWQQRRQAGAGMTDRGSSGSGIGTGAQHSRFNPA
ncbi:AAA family ATPase [Exilibacterium tricleocarpae]|uniref:AAA family ATPase n=1 Tax=Exilibacterium tricleocarpae TaxID=2591008 RepID=A0A545T3M4_9GAMM|nr:AAA family ATPase [Exilibacterium tricleocarpae]TQV71823.1 AAA family ATPase [Exilibacterium tricleocarpae]